MAALPLAGPSILPVAVVLPLSVDKYGTALRTCVLPRTSSASSTCGRLENRCSLGLDVRRSHPHVIRAAPLADAHAARRVSKPRRRRPLPRLPPRRDDPLPLSIEDGSQGRFSPRLTTTDTIHLRYQPPRSSRTPRGRLHPRTCALTRRARDLGLLFCARRRRSGPVAREPTSPVFQSDYGDCAAIASCWGT